MARGARGTRGAGGGGIARHVAPRRDARVRPLPRVRVCPVSTPHAGRSVPMASSSLQSSLERRYSCTGRRAGVSIDSQGSLAVSRCKKHASTNPAPHLWSILGASRAATPAARGRGAGNAERDLQATSARAPGGEEGRPRTTNVSAWATAAEALAEASWAAPPRARPVPRRTSITRRRPLPPPSDLPQPRLPRRPRPPPRIGASERSAGLRVQGGS